MVPWYLPCVQWWSHHGAVFWTLLNQEDVSVWDIIHFNSLLLFYQTLTSAPFRHLFVTWSIQISCFIISASQQFRVQAQTTCPTNFLVQNVNNQSGLIQSSFTTTYSSNMNCEWTLSADTKLELVFVGPFTTESNADFVYVYDGNSSIQR